MRDNQLVVAEDLDSFTTMLSSLKLEAGSPGPLEAETPCPLEEEAPGPIEVETSGLLEAETPSPPQSRDPQSLQSQASGYSGYESTGPRWYDCERSDGFRVGCESHH